MYVRTPLIHVNTGMDGMDGTVALHVTKTIAAGAKTAYFENDTAGHPAQPVRSAPTMVPSIRSIRPTLLKQYAGCRHHDPAAGASMTSDVPAAVVQNAASHSVLDADSGIDITSSILEQIIRKRALHG